MDVVNAVESMLSPLLSDKGIELIDVQWRGESNGWILRVFLDKPGGISLDECAHWSSTLGDFIEENQILTRHYSLEVSSPGPDRPLKKREHFQRFLGNGVVVKTVDPQNNQKNFRGRLMSIDTEALEMVDRSSGVVRIPLNNILRAHLDPDS